MADFFSMNGENHLNTSSILLKRKCFEKEIRSKDIETKIKQLRIVGSDGPHIKSMINALPSSLPDLYEFMLDNPSYHEAITKTIVDKIYKH